MNLSTYRPTPSRTVEKVLDSFHAINKRFMDQLTNRQVADGLDKLYEDYRNRSILISDGVWLVPNAISGKSDKEMEVLIENFRKYAK